MGGATGFVAHFHGRGVPAGTGTPRAFSAGGRGRDAESGGG